MVRLIGFEITAHEILRVGIKKLLSQQKKNKILYFQELRIQQSIAFSERAN